MIDIYTILYIICFVLYLYILIRYYNPARLHDVMLGIDKDEPVPTTKAPTTKST